MASNPFLRANTEPTGAKNNWVVDLLQSVVIAFFIVIVVYLFIVIPNQVSGDSMIPNFSNQQLVLTSKINQWLGGTELGENLKLNYKRGEVVVFQKPGRVDLIKRVIGLPGDTVMVLDCEVYVNDLRIEEEYIPDTTCTTPNNFATEGKLIQLDTDQYFLMGDNRENSNDSRSLDYGLVEREWIKGKVVLRYLPFDKFGVIGAGKITYENGESANESS